MAGHNIPPTAVFISVSGHYYVTLTAHWSPLKYQILNSENIATRVTSHTCVNHNICCCYVIYFHAAVTSLLEEAIDQLRELCELCTGYIKYDQQ